jgi:DNA-binding response OmpR family regulator
LTAVAPRVLVIDSDPDTLRLIDIKLRRAGFEVLTALSGTDGLAWAAAKRPDVILAEVELSGCDGRALVAEARRQLTGRVPIAILMSRSDAQADIVAALASGADDYIVKPFSPRELMVRINVALARLSQRDELEAPAVTTGEHGA